MARTLLEVFQAWRLVGALTMLAGFRAEVERLRSLVQKKSASIWNMHKSELVEAAVRELGMNLAAAQAETVIVLRERLRKNRAATQEEADPMLRVPPGLERMLHSQLLEECKARGLDTQALPGSRGEHRTRPHMILMIREDVDRRVIEWQRATRGENRTSTRCGRARSASL